MPYANQIRFSETGSSIGEPSELREVQAGAVREIGASVWATRDAVPVVSPECQDAGQPDHARIASDEAPVGGSGDIITGQSEECVTVAGAGEEFEPDDPASAPDDHRHGEVS